MGSVVSETARIPRLVTLIAEFGTSKSTKSTFKKKVFCVSLFERHAKTPIVKHFQKVVFFVLLLGHEEHVRLRGHERQLAKRVRAPSC